MPFVPLTSSQCPWCGTQLWGGHSDAFGLIPHTPVCPVKVAEERHKEIVDSIARVHADVQISDDLMLHDN